MPLLSGEPSTEAQATAELFRWFRGGVIAGFAQVEFTMGRTLSCMNSSSIGFKGVNKYSNVAKKRAEIFKNVFLMNDILSDYAPVAVQISDRFIDQIEMRNFLVHGFAKIDMKSEAVSIRRFIPITGNEWNEAEFILPIEKIQPLGEQIDQYVQASVKFALDVSEAFDLKF